jgi:hypothetical protein
LLIAELFDNLALTCKASACWIWALAQTDHA